MRTGWLLDRGSWYYLSDSGAMAVGWVQVDGSWLLHERRRHHADWLGEGGFLLVLPAYSGAMLTGTQTINGRTYVFDESGAWVR